MTKGHQASLARRVAAEGLGTAILLIAIVGSGIVGERLAGGNVAIALLANALATAGALAVAILVFASISGAHFNPVVTVAFAVRRMIAWADVPSYLVAQIAGAVVGVFVVHLMFEMPVIEASSHIRAGAAQALSEFVATFGLLVVIFGLAESRSAAIPYAVACYIGSAYWFASSTSFANPAVTIARGLTNTFSGIRLADAPLFLLAQCLGASAAVLFCGWLLPRKP